MKNTRLLLIAHIDYSPETGRFTWIKPLGKRVKAGDNAGCVDKKNGYYKVGFMGESHLGHRLAWFMVTGLWPKSLDHINGDKSDNRICNPREVNDSENQQNRHKPKSNNLTGLMGVSNQNGRWKSCIEVGKVRTHLGYFDTKELAHAAYLAAKQRLHPFGAVR